MILLAPGRARWASEIWIVDPRISETIKLKATTFMFRGSIASFYPRSTKHVSLMFHTGARLPDPTGLLEGEGDVSRVARFHDQSDLVVKADSLRGLVAAWIEPKDLSRDRTYSVDPW